MQFLQSAVNRYFSSSYMINISDFGHGAVGIDHFRLHHPRPRGVLRTQIEAACHVVEGIEISTVSMSSKSCLVRV